MLINSFIQVLTSCPLCQCILWVTIWVPAYNRIFPGLQCWISLRAIKCRQNTKHSRTQDAATVHFVYTQVLVRLWWNSRKGVTRVGISIYALHADLQQSTQFTVSISSSKRIHSARVFLALPKDSKIWLVSSFCLLLVSKLNFYFLWEMLTWTHSCLLFLWDHFPLDCMTGNNGINLRWPSPRTCHSLTGSFLTAVVLGS